MKCLVTGGAGFIGSTVVDYLIAENHEVVVIDDLSTGDKNNLNKKAKFYEMSILAKNLVDIFKKENIEIVFHLAAQINVRKSIENPIADAEKNIIGSLNLLEACVKSKVKKIIFSSTGGAIYGDSNIIPTNENTEKKPESPYGIAKLTIENYIEFYNKVHGLDYTILRYGNVYGPRQNAKGEAGVISIFINNLLQNKPITIFGDGNQTRDYVYVKDVARANIVAIKNSGKFNVGTSKETSINEIVRLLKKISNKEIKVVNTAGIKGELIRSCLNNNRIKEKGWKVEYDLNEGLKETFDFFNKLSS